MKKLLLIFVILLSVNLLYAVNDKEMVIKIEQQQVINNKQIDKVNYKIQKIKSDKKKMEQIWQQYYDIKLKLHQISQSRDTADIIIGLLQAEKWAEILNRPDIISWEFNDIGLETIKCYQWNQANGQQNSKELLLYGKSYLELAQKIENKILGNKDKKDLIKRNLDTIKKCIKEVK